MTAHEALATAFLADHPDDAARLLERGDPSDAAAVLSAIPAASAAGVLDALAPAMAAAAASLIEGERLSPIIERLPLDAAAATLRRVEPERRQAVLEALTDDRRESIALLLSFPDDSAGALADPLVLALPEDITVTDAQKQLRDASQHLFYYVYIIARDRTLVGTLAMPELMTARPKETLAAAMQRNPVRLHAFMDLATAAAHPAWRDYDALPVVDGNGRLIGAIRHKTMRQMSIESRAPMTSTIIGLSELYWAGLSGILASLAQATVSEEGSHVS